MFIRAVRRKNLGSGQVYIYHQLIESVRTPQGPRQRILLNLGTLDIAPGEWNFQHLSHNALYRLADLLAAHRAVIETHLARQARKIFSPGRENHPHRREPEPAPGNAPGGAGGYQREQGHHHPGEKADPRRRGHPLLPELSPRPEGNRHTHPYATAV